MEVEDKWKPAQIVVVTQCYRADGRLGRVLTVARRTRSNPMSDASFPRESYKPGNCDVCGFDAEKYLGDRELCADCYVMEA